MLKDALVSVASQTSMHSIAKVIVSENGENRASENVCSDFSSIPIEYHYQENTLPVLKHIQLLLSKVSSEYVAFLHDDDWWASNHLELSLTALNNGNCSSVFSNFVETASPKHPFTVSYKSFRIWALSGRDFSRNVIQLSQADNFLNCLVDSSYHFSTFVGNTNLCLSAWDKVVLSQNDYDCDRTFPIFLGEKGNVAYIPASTTFIRIHSNQDSARADYVANDTGWKLKAATTEWVAKYYPELLVEARELFNGHVLPNLSSKEIDELFGPIGEAQKEALAMICSLKLPMPKIESQPSHAEFLNQRTTASLQARVIRKIYSILAKR
jgi:hypothetical protein